MSLSALFVAASLSPPTVRRDAKGQFKESVDVGRSLSADKRQKAKHDAKPGEGENGDHKSK
jgi:hypothetical protein